MSRALGDVAIFGGDPGAGGGRSFGARDRRLGHRRNRRDHRPRAGHRAPAAGGRAGQHRGQPPGRRACRGSLAGLHARDGDAGAALGYFRRVIPQWRQAGAWTPQWVTIRTLIDLLTRVGACRDAATLYGAVTSATTGPPPYGADAVRLHEITARLRDTLTAAEFQACTERGEQLDSHQVIDLALDAIARATTGWSRAEAPSDSGRRPTGAWSAS